MSSGMHRTSTTREPYVVPGYTLQTTEWYLQSGHLEVLTVPPDIEVDDVPESPLVGTSSHLDP